MSEPPRQPPFSALMEIAAKGQKFAAGLPAQVEIQAQWSGVGFMLCGERFIAPLTEVSELLGVPKFTTLPGVKSWVKGVANVRGRLLPIIDLNGFFGFSSLTPQARHRVLVLEQEEIYNGLIVDQVFGMHHFSVDTFKDEVEVRNQFLAPYLRGSYEKNDERWTIFSLGDLAKDPNFYEVQEIA